MRVVGINTYFRKNHGAIKMVSAIDPSKPADGVPAVKLDLRNNLQAARNEIETLQAGKTDFGHQHVLADITDAGALAGKSVVALGDIASAAVTSVELGAAAVVEAALADGAVSTAKIAAGAVTEVQIAPAAIVAAALADGAVTTTKIGDAAVTEAKIAATAVVEAALADGAVSTAKIADAAVIGSKVAPATIDTAALADGAVATAKIADAAVIGSKVAPATIDSAALADGAVTGVKIADAAVTSGKLAAGAVTAAGIDDAAVATAKIADAAVTRAKLAPASVGADQLEDGIPIDMQDAVLRSPELRDFAETSPAATISGGVLTLDYEAGSVFEVTLTENVATLALVNPPAAGRAGSCTVILRQDGTGGRTMAWPGAVRWPGGSAPAITDSPNAIDVISLVTRDGGATWFGFPSGQAFS